MNLGIYNRIRNKIAIKYSRIVYNCKNVLLNGVASSLFAPPILRIMIYKQFGYNIGKESTIYHQCFCGVGNGRKGRLSLGEHSYINYRCFLDLGDDIVIGN